MLCSLVLACSALLLPQQAAQGLDLAEPELYVPARRWALVVGASDYSYLGRLDFAARDAEAFASSLTEHFGFDPSTIRLLTDGADDSALRPTAGNTFLALRKLLANPRLQETDLFIFYFAGHGIGDESGDYLLPLDAAVETVTDVGLHVQDVIRELTSAGMSNVLFVVDGCRTGTENTFGRELWKLAEEANLAVVLSCEPGEQSFEDRRLGGGVFTHYFVEALEDSALVDDGSGALWASRVAQSVRERAMAWTSRGFDGQQVPQVWTDPTRDVLLGAQLPSGASAVSAFRSGAEQLDQERYIAAAGRYAELLFVAERFGECAELLKAAEQMGDLPPQLLYLLADSLQAGGRLVEMARVQDQLRAADPDSFYTLTAIAHDLSGETSAEERYLASRRLLAEFPVETEDLALLIAFNVSNGAPHDEARAILAELLPRFRPETRAWAYATYMALLLESEFERGAELLSAAEGLPGGFPSKRRLRVEHASLLRVMRRDVELGELLDRCIEDWPQSGSWRAKRASFRYGRGDWAGAKADAIAALQAPLESWSFLQAVRAAGIDSGELFDAAQVHAARSPLSWQAQLALAMTTFETQEAHQAALDKAKRLAPNLGTWSATVAAIQYERGREALARGKLDAVSFSNLRYRLLDILADRAGELDQGEGWELLCELAGISSRQVQLDRLIELHLADELADGRLQRSLIGPISLAFLDVGRLARAHEAASLAGRNSELARDSAWREVAWLVAADRDEEARARLEELPEPGAATHCAAHFLRACLAARAGDEERVQALLESAPEVLAGDGLATALAGLTFEALGQTDRADHHYYPLLGTTGTRPFFAKAACWRALAARDLPREERELLAFAASRDGIGNPLCATLSFAAEPGAEHFVSTQEFTITDGGGQLAATGAALLLSVRREGKVSGIIELASGDVWSLKGQIDEYGNLDAKLLGADQPAQVWAKLAPPAVYASCAPLAEHGLVFHVLDEAGCASGWIAR